MDAGFTHPLDQYHKSPPTTAARVATSHARVGSFHRLRRTYAWSASLGKYRRILRLRARVSRDHLRARRERPPGRAVGATGRWSRFPRRSHTGPFAVRCRHRRRRIPVSEHLGARRSYGYPRREDRPRLSRRSTTWVTMLGGGYSKPRMWVRPTIGPVGSFSQRAVGSMSLISPDTFRASPRPNSVKWLEHSRWNRVCAWPKTLPRWNAVRRDCGHWAMRFVPHRRRWHFDILSKFTRNPNPRNLNLWNLWNL